METLLAYVFRQTDRVAGTARFMPQQYTLRSYCMGVLGLATGKFFGYLQRMSRTIDLPDHLHSGL